MPFLPFVYGYPSSSPRAHYTPTKAYLLCATPAGMDLYTGPCLKALTECSPLDRLLVDEAWEAVVVENGMDPKQTGLHSNTDKSTLGNNDRSVVRAPDS